jgi:Predicted phosphatase homologous to the C-terminal domain of histone macroH2A1
MAACYRNSLALAVKYRLSSIAFPAISTGAYGYPQEEAAVVASETIRDFLMTDTSLKEVRLVFYKLDAAAVFLKNQRFSAPD